MWCDLICGLLCTTKYGQYEAVILSAINTKLFVCFVPGFEQPEDPHAVDVLNTFHIKVIERDFKSQTSVKNKLLSAGGSLMESKISREVSQWES